MRHLHLPEDFELITKLVRSRLESSRLRVITGAGFTHQKDIFQYDAFLRSSGQEIAEYAKQMEIDLSEAEKYSYWFHLERARITTWNKLPAASYYFLYRLISDKSYVDTLVTTNYDLVWDAVFTKTLDISDWSLNPVLKQNEEDEDNYYREENSGFLKYFKIHGSLSHAYFQCCGRLLRLPHFGVDQPEGFFRRMIEFPVHHLDWGLKEGQYNSLKKKCAQPQCVHFIDNNIERFKIFEKRSEAFTKEITRAISNLERDPEPAGVIIAGFSCGDKEELNPVLKKMNDKGIPLIFLLNKNQEKNTFLNSLNLGPTCYMGSEIDIHLLGFCSELLNVNSMLLCLQAESEWKRMGKFI